MRDIEEYKKLELKAYREKNRLKALYYNFMVKKCIQIRDGYNPRLKLPDLRDMTEKEVFNLVQLDWLSSLNISFQDFIYLNKRLHI